MREGNETFHDRPFDEIAHAKWIERTENYIQRRMPDVRIPSCNEVLPIDIPDLLDPNYRKSDPFDATIARTDSGRNLAEIFITMLASAIERLELEIENEDKRI